MHWLSLPEARQNLQPAFKDSDAARSWLASQAPQALPRLQALKLQIEAIDGAELPPGLTIELLNLLRSAALPVLESIEPRFSRKALPMSAEEQSCFEVACQVWHCLGIAYLRRAAQVPATEQALPLNRAACALRIAEYYHFQAACECPVQLDLLLFAVLAQAEKSGLLLQALADPDFPHLGEANIAGHLAWAFLLRLIDPYRLSAAQLIVANRAISRWRELCSFQFELDANPKTQAVDLARLFGGPLPADLPRWLNVRVLVRKSRQRIEALQAGESPETLKLGRELSAAACIRLLTELNASLRPPMRPPSTEIGEIALSFGGENAYAVYRGEYLKPVGNLDAKSASLAHQRMAIFGFDRLSQMPTAVKTLNIPRETWNMVDGKALRPAEQASTRRLAPCLIAASLQGRPRLGVMRGLHSTATGSLAAQLDWYETPIEAGWLRQSEPKIPAFILRSDESLTLILPAGSIRLGSTLAVEGTSTKALVPTEVLERGVDFVRYACRPG